MQGDIEESLSTRKARLQPAPPEATATQRLPEQNSNPLPPASYRHHPRPLIDLVDNKWRVEKVDDIDYTQIDDDEDLSFLDLDDDESCPSVSRDLLASRRFRKMMAVFIMLAVALYYLWANHVKPRLENERLERSRILQQASSSYGTAQGGDADQGLVRVQTLSQHLLPGGQHDPEGRRRLVFVGDVHGCKDELMSLLEKVGFDEQHDHLVLVGDVISKGPDSVGVLDELIRLKASTVRGNHEDRVLIAARSFLSTDVPLSAAATSKGSAKDDALLRQLKPHHLQYLRATPMLLRIPALPRAPPNLTQIESLISEDILVVHAGLVPGVPISRQDPYFVMNMRSIHAETHVPSATRATKGGATKPWFDVWGWFNDRVYNGKLLVKFDIFEDEQLPTIVVPRPWYQNLWNNAFSPPVRAGPSPLVVVYGHDSKAGLQIKRWSKGLDTACVSGGELTALVLNAQGRQDIVSVRCRDS